MKGMSRRERKVKVACWLKGWLAGTWPGIRFKVNFERILTPVMKGDISQVDIRDIISNNAIKDLMKDQDEKMVTLVSQLPPGSWTTHAWSQMSRKAKNKAIKRGRIHGKKPGDGIPSYELNKGKVIY